MNKTGPARQFEGGSEVICDIRNYRTELHKHSNHCRGSIDENGFCNTTKHQLHCFSITDEFASIYPRKIRREVKKLAKNKRFAHKTTADIIERYL